MGPYSNKGQPVACSPVVDSTEILHGTKTDIVFLVFHGFAGNPAQMTGLIDVLSVYDGNIITPRIYGHFDQNMDDLDDVTFEQWLDQGRAALSVAQGLGETVIVAGYSLGGLIASRLALETPEQIDGLILLAPAWRLTARAVLESDIGALFGIRSSPLGDTQICAPDAFDVSAPGAVEVHRLAQNSQVSFGLGAFAGLGPAIALTIGDADQIVASPFVQWEIGRVQPNIPPIIIADEGHLFFIQSSDLYESGQALGRRFIDSVQALVRDVAR
jgi:pimeloyl-ACP methyl ester carboxylesterase